MSKCNCMSPAIVAGIERRIEEELFRQTGGTMGRAPRVEPAPDPLKLVHTKPAKLGPLVPRRFTGRMQ